MTPLQALHEEFHADHLGEKVFFGSQVIKAGPVLWGELGLSTSYRPREPEVLELLRSLVNVRQGTLTLRRDDWDGVSGFYVEEFTGTPGIESVRAALLEWRPVGHQFDAVFLYAALNHRTTRPEHRTLRAAWRSWCPFTSTPEPEAIRRVLRRDVVGQVVEGATLIESDLYVFEFERRIL